MVNVVLCCIFLYLFVNVSFQRDVIHAANFRINKRKSARIIGGQFADLNEYPWMVALCNGPKCSYKTQMCGGTLLTNKFIITAAHCIQGMRAGQLSVSLGDHNIYYNSETSSQVYQIEVIIKHNVYNSKTWVNDIALLKVKGKVKLNDNVRPVCLPISNVWYGNKIAIATGWGRTSEGGRSSKTLKEVKVTVVKEKICRKKYGEEFLPGMLCTGSKNKDSCQGDSGGPLVLKNSKNKWELIGIVSWGYGCGSPGYPGLYTKVKYYLKWIKAIIGKIPNDVSKKCGKK